jgi:hypothetical protein
VSDIPEDLQEALEDLLSLDDEAEQVRYAFAGKMAAEAILCALPTWRPEGWISDALDRLREVDELVWAAAYWYLGRCDEPGHALRAGRRHGLGAEHARH